MSREIAIMIDGGFITKRLAKLVADPNKLTPKAVCGIIRSVCFILDPLWQKVSDDLFEHIDGLQTVLKKPGEVAKPQEQKIEGQD